MLYTAAFVCLLAGGAWAKDAPARSIDLSSIPRKARIMGLSLSIEGGMVSAVGNIPAGWRVSVVNDPSWQGHLNAVAIVGAAATGRAELGRMVMLVPAPPSVAKDLASRLSTTGTMTTLVRGEPVTGPVSSFKLWQSP